MDHRLDLLDREEGREHAQHLRREQVGAAPIADPLTATAIATASTSATWGVMEEAVEIKPTGQKVEQAFR